MLVPKYADHHPLYRPAQIYKRQGTDVDRSLGYLADVLTWIVNGCPNSRIDDLLRWAYVTAPNLKAGI
ncbi:hypothetical protein J2W42_006588 [Rhizobium tibeticum]|nr:hypothetical protein [Rhizobium tibeticum]